MKICLISEHTSRIDTSLEKRSHTNKSKSDRWGLSISLNPVKENLELPLKLTSGKGRSPKRKKNLKLQRYIKNSRESSEKPSEEIHHHKQKAGRKWRLFRRKLWAWGWHIEPICFSNWRLWLWIWKYCRVGHKL